jgi:DNA mismatch repair protein MutS
MIIDEYLDYTKTYKEKYGERCIVLMQVGSFFEIYTITDNITDNEVFIIADLCSIQTSRKNKAISEVSRANPIMAGFPLHSISKFTQILLNNNYTIVLVEQVSEPPNPKRAVTEILSPGANINISNKQSNYMMVIFYEIINGFVIAGISGIDLSTGKTFVYEVGSTKQDPEFAHDEIFRFISTYNPIELVILSEQLKDEDKKAILKKLNINKILVHYKWENCEYINFFNNIINQKEILDKAFFVKKGLISIIELLNLERFTIARVAFCCLLQFAYEHNSDIIKELQEPEIFENSKNMTIEYNSAVQLNILRLYQNDKPLIDILNKCITAFGARAFKDKLLLPMTNIENIKKSYDDIDFLLKNKIFQNIRKYLSNIVDLERMKRKMVLNKMPPMEWVVFNESLDSAVKIYNELNINNANINLKDITDIISYFNNIIDLDKASKYNLADKSNLGNFFKKGINHEIDELVLKSEEFYKKIENYVDNITKLGTNDSTFCKIDNNDREGYYIIMTKKRYETASKQNKNFMSGFNTKSMATSQNYKITNNEITKASNYIITYNDKISQLVLTSYTKFMNDFITNNNERLDNIIKYLTRVDIAACCAKNAFEYCYVRPDIDTEKTQRKSSFISMKNMRHPIIERIQDDIEYVGNDLELNQDGILLYGINASGKSSFMKGIGLNIIMAQAGMYVAAESMSYYPYNSIFTRISGMDNIYKGMSSFTVEMTELRNILQRCNKYSLVIGDEICCGTESISGISIVASGIDTLIKKGSCFIFASHLHELTKITCISKHIKDKSLSVKHIRITIDDKNRIIYDRKLQDGQGSKIYGIEVCKSLDMPLDFMKNAEKIRKEVDGINKDIVKNRKSRYNSNVIIDKCKICDNTAEETHHIVYQEKANDEGFLSNYHKNSKHNLVALCKECHKKEHSGELKIKGYIATSYGVVLDYTIV